MKTFDTLLESMIDKYGLCKVLDAIGTICAEKAEHLAVNWQDTTSAKAWDQAATEVDDLTVTIADRDDLPHGSNYEPPSDAPQDDPDFPGFADNH